MAFAFWRQEHPQATAGYALFGKLPLRADFVRVNAAIPVAQEYDQLLADAITALAQDDGWQSAYDVTDASLFAYRSSDRQNWFVGGQAPSRDGQGRRFPLVAGISRAAADIGADLPLLPLAFEVFYNGVADHLENAIANSVDAVSCRKFLEGFAGDALQTGTDFDLPRSLLQRFKREQNAGYLATILRMAYPQATLEQAVLNIAFYANFIRHYPHSGMASEIVLPLPKHQGVVALMVSVWLQLIGDLAGDAQRIAGFFFRDDFIVIAIDRFSEHFSPLLPLTNSAKGRGLMLTTEHDTWMAHPFYPEVSYAITRLLSDPHVILQSIFDCAEQIGKRLVSSE